MPPISRGAVSEFKLCLKLDPNNASLRGLIGTYRPALLQKWRLAWLVWGIRTRIKLFGFVVADSFAHKAENKDTAIRGPSAIPPPALEYGGEFAKLSHWLFSPVGFQNFQSPLTIWFVATVVVEISDGPKQSRTTPLLYYGCLGRSVSKCFLEYCVASLLSPGNLPGLKNTPAQQISHRHAARGLGVINATPIFRELTKYVEPVFHRNFPHARKKNPAANTWE